MDSGRSCLPQPDSGLADERTHSSRLPGVDVINIFLSEIYEFSQQARVFVPGELFQESFCLRLRPEPTLEWSTWKKVLHLGRLWSYLQALCYAWNACQGQTLQLIMKIRKLRTKKFYKIVPRCDAIKRFRRHWCFGKINKIGFGFLTLFVHFELTSFKIGGQGLDHSHRADPC